ncbi:hypothetical protein [Geomonas anaerohicana]|uniref:Lipoprotein n=1 Tax=Geomonas anaerohicana TaxID=2798583 RepID=A0ABS0YC86_9BACT|nr:hypothetical protein [Geomonas anaerohicana]MBJ6749928.1 hypothetical protein [Geomonas anaerohicana]
MGKLTVIVLGVSMLSMVVSCGKNEDAKNDKFRDWSVRDKRTVPPVPSFLDGYEKELGDRQKHQEGASK